MDLTSYLSDSLMKISNFQETKPIPYLIVDLNSILPTNLIDDFPNETWEHWRSLGDQYQKNKLQCNDIAVMPENIRNLIGYFSEPKFLGLLQKYTGIKGLIPDPYLTGGGLHLSTEGGQLDLHTDFHNYDRLNLYRRLNLLLYLNPDWEDGDGGELELCHRNQTEDMFRVRIEPRFGTLVIFETSDISVHGFTTPVAKGKTRRSIAIYYYTAIDTESFGGDYTTHWIQRSPDGIKNRFRHIMYRSLMQASRAFSLAAHIVNPRQGLSWWRNRAKSSNK